MANALDEVSGPVNEEGRDINVISKQIPVKVGVGSTIFEVILWVLGIIPGLVFLIMKIKAGEYFRKLEQRIQHDASQIDNYIEQRVVILQNTAKIMEKAIELDKETLTQPRTEAEETPTQRETKLLRKWTICTRSSIWLSKIIPNSKHTTKLRTLCARTRISKKK